MRSPTWNPTWWSTPGDNLAHHDAVPLLLDALDGLLDVPGVFVFGSNDYFAPTSRNPVRYLLPDDGQAATHTPAAAVARHGATASRRGAGSTCQPSGRAAAWVDTTFAFAGVDDPHLGYDDLAAVAGPADADR